MYSYKSRSIKNHSSGFTLIELLVVIAIIGVLASVVLASLGQARVLANNAKRVADLKQLQAAMEIYYVDNNRYPPTSSTYVTGITGLAPRYIPVLPTDPNRPVANGYRYYSSNYTLGYTMLALMEGATTWCKIGIEPGYTAWDTTYPRC